MKLIYSILGSRLLIFKCEISSPFFGKSSIWNRHVICCHYSIVGSLQLYNAGVLKGTLLFFTVPGIGLTFISPESSNINLKNESYLCNQIFAIANYES